jgi:UDP-glucose 4-epimerase
MTILVTGGAGYIGSHVTRALQRSGYRPVVLDNLNCGHRDIVHRLQVPLVEGSVGERSLLDRLLSGDHAATGGAPVQAVIHLAAYADVTESLERPDRYYRNNLTDSLVLLEALVAEGHRRGTGPLPLVFSSTSAIYGNPGKKHGPIEESCPQHPLNPYGRSKWMVEQLLEDFHRAFGLPNVVFRYFNAAGAHPEGDLGEHHKPETHLIPLILEVLSGRRPYLQIFGDDYLTRDGTCIRDYVHVCDLADAHVLALQQLVSGRTGHLVFNLGNGKGHSVREVIETAKSVAKRDLLAYVGPRRAGDAPVLIASVSKARRELGWNPQFPQLHTMIAHAWTWHLRRLPETEATTFAMAETEEDFPASPWIFG